ncbi:hypothetical protein QR680_005077 [Steinernema hermaphroditum]|uniref:Uncharacterized protein n=1 Tax=Steinernema hermaphroditum TaxID=289476 RepID=A0AA39LV17_9BILA|nr:hypothetical protein QR680_005077 [Steinernema hermaphroditum]
MAEDPAVAANVNVAESDSHKKAPVVATDKCDDSPPSCSNPMTPASNTTSKLAEYEKMFATRFTMESESFAAVAQNGFAKTVSVYPWTTRPKRNFDYGRQYRGQQRGQHGGYRRDWRREDRGSRDHSHSRNDRDRSRVDRDRNDRRPDRVQYPGRR